MKKIIILFLLFISFGYVYATDETSQYVDKLTDNLDFNRIISGLEEYCSEVDLDKISGSIIKRKRYRLFLF